MIKIAPSILSADFGRLNEEIKAVEPYSDLIHVDVMDGHFVPNITIGPAVVGAIGTRLPLDVHLMITDPIKYAPQFAKHAKMISFHAELFEGNTSGLRDALKKVKALGVNAGLALNPDKEVGIIEPALDLADYVLIMSVYAGFGGQRFIPAVLDKITRLRGLGYKKDIEIDGGINDKTAKEAAHAGATILVAGTAIFGAKDRKKAIDSLRSQL